MSKLLLLFTVVLSLYTWHGYADDSDDGDENSCESVELGSMGKNHWRDSLGNGFRGELTEAIQKEDELFEDLIPLEFEYDIIPNLKIKATLTRSVDDHLPKPKDGEISPLDLFKLQVDNRLLVELSGGASYSFLSVGANAGVNLTMTSYSLPGQNVSSCELYSKILDLKSEKGKEFYDGICVSRDKSKFAHYYDSAINYLSSWVGRGLRKFADTEKNIKFTEDPLSAMKIHSTLGVPLDYEIFFENSKEMAIGDIVEHTSYFGATPYSVNIPIIDFLTPGYSKYKRILRTLSFKKEIKNKVIVEIDDTVISGNTTRVFDIKTKILKYIKLNFGHWNRSKFKRQSLVQRFEVDLNSEDGLKFFRKVLFSAYNPSWKLKEDTILIDPTPYLNGVVPKEPIFVDANGQDRKFIFKFPEVFSYENRSYKRIDNTSFKNKKYLSGTNFHRKSLSNKLALNLGLFKIRKAERNFECMMRLNSDSEMKMDDDSTMNIDCKYYNRYASNEKISQVREFLDGILDGGMNPEDRTTLMSLDYTQRERINIFTNLSFSKRELKKIISTTEDEAYHHIARLFFGEKSKNVFAKKYHNLWKRATPGGKPGSLKRKRVDSPAYRNCSSLFKRLGITAKVDPLYNAFGGVIGRDKGIDASKSNRCYSYFMKARKVVRKLQSLQQMVSETGQLDKFLDMFLDLDEVGLAQAAMVKMAGGLSQKGVRFTYLLTSPYLEEMMVRTNGKHYEVKLPEMRKSIKTQRSPIFHSRIGQVRFTYNACDPKVLFAYIKLNYPVKDRSSIVATFRLADWSLAADEILETHEIKFDQMVHTEDGEYVARLNLEDIMDPDRSHSMYFEISNEHNFRLSREIKIYLKKLSSQIPDDEVVTKLRAGSKRAQDRLSSLRGKIIQALTIKSEGEDDNFTEDID